MVRKLLQMACLAACMTAWATTSLELSAIRQPRTVFVAGPGTIVSVHRLDMPFIEPHYVLQYKTDDGELIEVWHPGKDIPVLEGMHGMLTYSTQPEMVRTFRVIAQTLPK